MSFIINLSMREVRASWRRLVFFFLCIGIGVGSIVALRSVIGNVRGAVVGEARTVLTADVAVDSTRPFTDKQLAAINRAVDKQQANVTGRTETIESATMLRAVRGDGSSSEVSPANDVSAIELKGIEDNFPLVGEWVLGEGKKYDAALLKNNGALVSPALLSRLNLKIGDRVEIGTQQFEIRAVVEREPGGGNVGFQLGPRVFVNREALEQAGLTGFGSRARRRILLTVKEGAAEQVQSTLRSEAGDGVLGFRSYKDAQENLTRQFERAENYMSLAGLIVLVLGGIGVSNVVRVLIEQKRKTIAILKCVGATNNAILVANALQIVVLAGIGGVFGIALAKTALEAVRLFFAESLPLNVSYGLRLDAVAQGLLLGVLTAVLFSVLPLLGVRLIKPNMLLREADGVSEKHGFDVLKWSVGAICLAALIAVAAWQAGSLKVGLMFLAGLAATTGALWLMASLLTWLLGRSRERVTSNKSFAVRYALSGLRRPGNQTRTVVMATGLGVFLIIAVQILQKNLLQELDFASNPNAPNMFVIDVQPEQAESVRTLARDLTGREMQLVPTVRARITSVDGNRQISAGEQQRERGRIGREYVVTYRNHLEPNEQIIDGKFWNAAPRQANSDERPAQQTGSQPAETNAMPSEAEVSIEKGLLGLAGMKLGSRVVFDISGREIAARVTSVRDVDWRNSRTAFMFVFRPGVLDNAPQSLIAAINAPENIADRTNFTRALIKHFPNVTLIDVGEILRNVGRVISNITLGVSFIGAFIFLSGVLILIGSIAMTKFQRVYETAVLRTLGAENRSLVAMLLIEYGLQGLVAGVTGAVAALALSFAMARFVFEIEWTWRPLITIGGIVGAMLLVMLVGIVASLDILRKKPLSVLRAG